MSAHKVEKGGLLVVIADITQKCFTQGGNDKDFVDLQLAPNPFTFCLPDIQLAEVTRGLPTVAAPVLPNGPSASVSTPPELPPSAAPPPPLSTTRPLHTRQHRSGTRGDSNEHQQQQQHQEHHVLVWPVERVLGEPDASTGIVGPREGAQAFGLPHLIMHTSSEGLASVQELVEAVEGMVASGRKKITERGCQAEVLVGVAGKAVLAGTMVPLNEIKELVLDVHIVVKGGRLEKAINLYTRMILSDAYAADAHADSTAVEMRTADVVAGDGGERVWSVMELRGGQVAFAAVVKAATVAKAPVCMSMVVRVVTPAGEGSLAILRVRRSYRFHFRDEHDVFGSYDPIPLHTLLFGMFFTKEAALAYASIFQGGQNSTDLQPAKETFLQHLVDSEAACDHEGVFESLLPLALHDGMTEALRDLCAAYNGLGGRYTSLRSRAQIMADVVTHFRTVLTRRSKTVARELKSAPSVEQKDQLAAVVTWLEIVQTSLQAIREELREATAVPCSSPPEGRPSPTLLCSESLCLSAPLEWCMLALNNEHPELAGRRAGPEGMLEILERHLKELVGLLSTLERTILWDVRRALYKRERATMTQATAASPQARPTHVPTTPKIIGAQSAVAHHLNELKRKEAEQGTTGSAKTSRFWLRGLIGRRKPPRPVRRPAQPEATAMAAATASHHGSAAERASDGAPGAWVETLLETVCKRCGGVCIDTAAEARRFAALHEPQTGADGRLQGPCKKLPQVISREAVLLSYVVDTRFDAVVSKFLEEAMTGFVALPHVTAFARRVAQAAVWMELWTQPDDSLADQLAAAFSADIVKIAPAEGATAPGQSEGYATMTDSKAQVFGTASALAWADTASVFQILKEVEPLLTDPPLKAQAMSIFSSVALRGDALLCLPRATTMSTLPPTSLITLQVIVHAVYSSRDQEAAALSHFAQFVVRKADTLSKEAPHILVLSLALGRRSDTWRGGLLQFGVEQLTASAEAIKAAIRGSPRDVSVHCLMMVEGKRPSSCTTDTTRSATYQPCVIRMTLLRQGPAGQGEEAVNPCLFDPGIVHDTVFVDRKAAIRMSLFAQDTEIHNALPREDIEARWREDLLLRAAHADDAGDFFHVHKAYVKLIAADSSSEKFLRLMPSLARMMTSLAATLEGLVSTASALQVLLDEKVLSPVERAKIGQELLVQQAEGFITSMALALVSPLQLHLHGEVQHLTVTLYRFYVVVARRVDVLEQSDAAPAVTTRRTGAATSVDNHDSAGQMSVIDVFKSVSESYMVKRVVRKYADVDRKEPGRLLNELKEGMHKLKLAVARDVHDNCADVEACVAQDLLPTS